MELDSEVLDRGNGEVLEIYFCLVLYEIEVDG
jgi:hypothetical protein